MRYCILVAALCSIATALAQSEADGPKFQLRWGVKIPMRDGVFLNATIYEPAKRPKPVPVIFTLTPYIGDTYHERAAYFASKGYVYALVDERGRGNSGGVYEPFINDPHDGADVVEWLAKQPYSNGKVGMWGGSYAGFDQWATAKERPAHLATIVPAAAVHPESDFPNANGIISSYIIQWLSYTSGNTPNDHLFGDEYWTDKGYAFYKAGLPFEQFDAYVGNPSPTFQKWISLPPANDYFDPCVPTVNEFKALDLLILTITGHYDGDQLGALTYYRDHMRYATAGAKAKHYLIIGPWDHAGTRTPKREIGGLDFGQASMLDLNALHDAWYRWTMLGGPKPPFLKKRVACYVLGDDKWRYGDTLEGLTRSVTDLYLASGSEPATDVFHSGRLDTERVPGSEFDAWTFDPRSDFGGDLEHQDKSDKFLLDQQAATNLGGQGTIYHSAPFPHATELTGSTSLTLWLETDVPDTDIEAELFLIRADGSSIALTSDILDLRYRDSLRIASPIVPGQPFKIEMHTFTFFSRMAEKGSRLRLVVHSFDSAGARRNMNSGGDPVKTALKDARVAHIKLFHDATHSSVLHLPIG